jgi:hypothetical protein
MKKIAVVQETKEEKKEESKQTENTVATIRSTSDPLVLMGARECQLLDLVNNRRTQLAVKLATQDAIEKFEANKTKNKADNRDASCHIDGRPELPFLAGRNNTPHFNKFDIHAKACVDCQTFPQYRYLKVCDSKFGERCVACCRFKMLLHTQKKYMPIKKFFSSWLPDDELLFMEEYRGFTKSLDSLFHGPVAVEVKSIMRRWKGVHLSQLSLTGEADEFRNEIMKYEAEYIDYNSSKTIIKEIANDSQININQIDVTVIDAIDAQI